jgi:hypothetical protein
MRAEVTVTTNHSMQTWTEQLSGLAETYVHHRLI